MRTSLWPDCAIRFVIGFLKVGCLSCFRWTSIHLNVFYCWGWGGSRANPGNTRLELGATSEYDSSLPHGTTYSFNPARFLSDGRKHAKLCTQFRAQYLIWWCEEATLLAAPMCCPVMNMLFIKPHLNKAYTLVFWGNLILWIENKSSDILSHFYFHYNYFILVIVYDLLLGHG